VLYRLAHDRGGIRRSLAPLGAIVCRLLSRPQKEVERLLGTRLPGDEQYNAQGRRAHHLPFRLCGQVELIAGRYRDRDRA
jgi:hypothetical protein